MRSIAVPDSQPRSARSSAARHTPTNMFLCAKPIVRIRSASMQLPRPRQENAEPRLPGAVCGVLSLSRIDDIVQSSDIKPQRRISLPATPAFTSPPHT